MSQEKGEKKQEHCAYTMRIICKMLSESIIVEIKKTRRRRRNYQQQQHIYFEC